MKRIVRFGREKSLVFSPIALQLRDELTGQKPIGAVRYHLQEQIPGTEQWRDTHKKPFATEDGILTYPGLGRTAGAVNGESRNHRILIDADYYRPLYQRQQPDGYHFKTFLYHDENPLSFDSQDDQFARGPSNAPSENRDVPPRLLPNSQYPFPAHLPVLKAKLIERNSPNRVVANAQVSYLAHTAVSDEQGAIFLPVPFPPSLTSTIAQANPDQDFVMVNNARGYSKARIGILNKRLRIKRIEVGANGARLVLNNQLGVQVPSGTAVKLLRVAIEVIRINHPPRHPTVAFTTLFVRNHRIAVPN